MLGAIGEEELHLVDCEVGRHALRRVTVHHPRLALLIDQVAPVLAGGDGEGELCRRLRRALAAFLLRGRGGGVAGDPWVVSDCGFVSDGCGTAGSKVSLPDEHAAISNSAPVAIATP